MPTRINAQLIYPPLQTQLNKTITANIAIATKARAEEDGMAMPPTRALPLHLVLT
ncbi:hypothetical protein H6G89_29645 [Oscillatoria sp. FACHB-1407]|uniref:hypothetical protein n=1 Tax=Oscillatoria sp. FACHB-1407 TaxID=2692847 RepID=UPI001686F110|nr:hypothetical protein [Oscillatoria sp. FACHB-1407]MBD2465176.1 hypothetical protein [Oscillatoria sp. FACHB-1407]